MTTFYPEEFKTQASMAPQLFGHIRSNDLHQKAAIERFGSWHRAPKVGEDIGKSWGLFSTDGLVFTMTEGMVIYLWDLSPEEFKTQWREQTKDLFAHIVDHEEVVDRNNTYRTIFALLVRNELPLNHVRTTPVQNLHLAALISDFLEANGIASTEPVTTLPVGTKPTFNLNRTSETSWTVLNNSLIKSDRLYCNGAPECDPMEALRRLADGERVRGYRLFSHLVLEHMAENIGAPDEVAVEGDFSTVYRIDPVAKTILVVINGEATVSLVF